MSNLEVAIVALVSISAFSAYRWLALTGNIAVLEAPLAALSIAALHRRRYELSGAAFGLMGTLKVLPLVGVLAFLVIPVGWPQKARAIAAAVAAFVTLHLLNAAVSGAYTVSFVKATLGQIPNQPALFSEPGGLNNPNFHRFCLRVVSHLQRGQGDIGLVGPRLLRPDPGRGDRRAGA